MQHTSVGGSGGKQPRQQSSKRGRVEVIDPTIYSNFALNSVPRAHSGQFVDWVHDYVETDDAIATMKESIAEYKKRLSELERAIVDNMVAHHKQICLFNDGDEQLSYYESQDQMPVKPSKEDLILSVQQAFGATPEQAAQWYAAVHGRTKPVISKKFRRSLTNQGKLKRQQREQEESGLVMDLANAIISV